MIGRCMTELGTASNRIQGVQALRALAASMVLIFHIFAISQFDQYSSLGTIKQLSLFSNYWAGVDLFFCISGFIFFNSYSRNEFKISKFAIGRVIRILPTYYLMTIVTIIAYTFEGNESKLSTSYLIRSFLLIVNLANGNPVLAVGWSLQFEFLFYILFCGIYLRKRKHNFAFFSAGALLVTLLPGIGFLFIEFLFGAIVFHLYEKITWDAKVIKCLILVTLFGVGLELSYINSSQLHSYRLFLIGIPFAFLVLLFSKFDNASELFIRLGDYSYSLYLTHTFSITILFRILLLSRVNLSFGTLMVILVLTNIFSYVFWKNIEVPLTMFLKRKIVR
jgi:peptidoglycan/LPS O-acetylase OafA/YrhL